ncbi:MAG: OmpH family outer membrane protein [Acidobacteria bacterium]|nr:OmpH family outer membrane protein [Acidobacteriota bacterium]
MLFRAYRLWLASGMMLWFSAAATAQTKVAIIDMREAVNTTAEVKKAVSALEAKLKPKQVDADKLQRDLQDIQNKLQTLQGKLTPQGEAELMAQGQRKQRELQRLQEDLDAELQREQQEVGARALQRMREVVKKLAEAQQLDVVVDVGQTIYFKPQLDLTKTAVSEYDKAFPVK